MKIQAYQLTEEEIKKLETQNNDRVVFIASWDDEIGYYIDIVTLNDSNYTEHKKVFNKFKNKEPKEIEVKESLI